jgi:galactokinase
MAYLSPPSGAGTNANSLTQLAERAAGLARRFEQRFGAAPEGVWAAPGRANLIGEHTDYNAGFALPFGLEQRALVALRRRSDARLLLCSEQTGASELGLAELRGQRIAGWPAYVAGVAWAAMDAGAQGTGFELLLDSDVPMGAGLSSSAALECATLVALAELWGFDRTPLELALLAQRAEQRVAGVPCGLMDQLTSMCARQAQILLVDFASASVTPLPLPLAEAGLELWLIDTRAPHQLADGAYAERRAACQDAARALGVSTLREADASLLSSAAGRLSELAERRARHVISENARVLEAAEILSGAGPASRLERLGPLLSASHASLQQDFEVSVPQLDVAQSAAEAAGALGARLIGGGFGGSVLALTPAGAGDELCAVVSREFALRGWAAPRLFPARPAAGAARLV